MPNLTILNDNSIRNIKKDTDLIRLPHLDPSISIRFGCCQGDCGTCAIVILEGKENLSPMTKQEMKTLTRLKLDSNSHRLACQCAIRGDVTVMIENKKF